MFFSRDNQQFGWWHQVVGELHVVFGILTRKYNRVARDKEVKGMIKGSSPESEQMRREMSM